MSKTALDIFSQGRITMAIHFLVLLQQKNYTKLQKNKLSMTKHCRFRVINLSEPWKFYTIAGGDGGDI